MCSYHKSGNHSDNEGYHQRNGSRNSPANGESTKDETFVADSNVTGCDKCSCDKKSQKLIMKNYEKPNNTPPGIRFSSAMCHPPLSQEAEGFQLLVDSGSSKLFIDQELIRGVESRILKYTRIESPMENRATGDNVLYGTAQGILLVAVRGTGHILKTVKLPIVLVPGLRNIFSSSAAAQKGVNTIIEINVAHLLTLDHLMFS